MFDCFPFPELNCGAATTFVICLLINKVLSAGFITRLIRFRKNDIKLDDSELLKLIVIVFYCRRIRIELHLLPIVARCKEGWK